MKVVGKFLCWFGFHKGERPTEISLVVEVCKRCKKKKHITFTGRPIPGIDYYWK